MKARAIGCGIGAASLAFGITDMIMGPTFGRGIGAGEKRGGLLFRIVAAREIATGIAGLIAPASPVPVGWRLAGDLFDLAALGYIAAPANPKQKMAFLAVGIVAAVAIADAVALCGMTKLTSA